MSFLLSFFSTLRCSPRQRNHPCPHVGFPFVHVTNLPHVDSRSISKPCTPPSTCDACTATSPAASAPHVAPGYTRLQHISMHAAALLARRWPAVDSASSTTLTPCLSTRCTSRLEFPLLDATRAAASADRSCRVQYVYTFKTESD
jgi:hypothetical protein